MNPQPSLGLCQRNPQQKRRLLQEACHVRPACQVAVPGKERWFPKTVPLSHLPFS